MEKDRFKQLLESTMGNVKPLINEDDPKVQTVVNKVATEGIKNLSPQMISDPPFPGSWNQYTFGGIYNGVNYQWDCTGVEGMVSSSTRRGGLFTGDIVTGNSKDMFDTVEERYRPKDFNPETDCVGIWNSDSQDGFVIYITTANKPKFTILH